MIASDSVVIISIVLAIYMTTFSTLIPSELAGKMKKTPDRILKNKTQLGVLREYLNCAIIFGITNIILSCIIQLESDSLKKGGHDTIDSMISSIAFGVLSINIFLMYYLYRFMINRQIWNK